MVGTHALLQFDEGVQFGSLGVVVIDEQHRFGVEQRATLRAKGTTGDPDLLVMTATPIPRTAAMVMFGDLDATVLDELPPGRIAITTKWLPNEDEADEAWSRVRSEVAAGHRAFVVCPLVSDSTKVEAKSSTQEYERLSTEELAGLKVGLLHGQMPSTEREETMAALSPRRPRSPGGHHRDRSRRGCARSDGDGDRERRSLRHRAAAPAAGPRGSGPGPELVLPAGAGVPRRPRARAPMTRPACGWPPLRAPPTVLPWLKQTYELRGEGTILGSRQKGQSDLRLASLSRQEDRLLLAEARRVAESIIAEDPQLELEEHQLMADEVRLMMSEDEADYLFKS